MAISREEILSRLLTQIQFGKPIVGCGAGTGISAKFAEKGGAKDMYQRIQERLKDIIENHKAPPLPDNTLAALQDIKQRGEKELTGK